MDAVIYTTYAVTFSVCVRFALSGSISLRIPALSRSLKTICPKRHALFHFVFCELFKYVSSFIYFKVRSQQLLAFQCCLSFLHTNDGCQCILYSLQVRCVKNVECDYLCSVRCLSCIYLQLFNVPQSFMIEVDNIGFVFSAELGMSSSVSFNIFFLFWGGFP